MCANWRIIKKQQHRVRYMGFYFHLFIFLIQRMSSKMGSVVTRKTRNQIIGAIEREDKRKKETLKWP